MVQRIDVPALTQQTVFNVQWTDCPVDVYEEVARKLWPNMEFGNDYYYYKWSGDEYEAEEYPLIASYLRDNNVDNCLIHWWW